MVNVIWWIKWQGQGEKTGPADRRLSQQAKQKRPGQSKIRKERTARQAKNQAIPELKCIDFIPMILGDIINFIPILLLKSQEPELSYCGWKKSWADRDGLSHSSPLFFYMLFHTYRELATRILLAHPPYHCSNFSVFAGFSTSIHRISKFLPPLTSSTLRCHFPATFDDMRWYIP